MDGRRPERGRLPRHPAAEDEQEPAGEDLVHPRQRQMRPDEHEQDQDRECAQLPRRGRHPERAAAQPRPPAVDLAQGAQDQRQDHQRAAKRIGTLQGEEPGQQRGGGDGRGQDRRGPGKPLPPLPQRRISNW